MLASLHRAVEGLADDALRAVRRIDALLGRDLLRRAATQHTTGADVGSLGALAIDDEVDLIRTLARERPGDTGVELDRPVVDVVVELEAQGQQHAALQHAGRHGRVADRAEQDRVVGAQLLEHRGRQGLAGAVVEPGAQVVLLGGHGHVAAHGVKDLEGLGHHLGADAVAGDESDIEGARHGRKASGGGARLRRRGSGAGPRA